MRRSVSFLYLTILGVCLAACGGPSGDRGGGGEARTFRAIDPEVADFWDRQTTENADLLRAIVDDFNAGHGGLPVKVIQSGNYGDIYTKTVAGIKARTLPSMAVAYGNMTLEYAREGAVAELDPFITDPEVGLSKEELADFFPAVLEQNRYAAHDGAYLSFPYTKAVLVLYFNTRVMGAAGLSEPPKTWDEFLEQCRAIKKATGKYAFCFDVDASAVNGIIYSMGGEVLGAGANRPQYQTAEAQATLELLDTLFKEKLAYQNPPRTFNDQTAFGNDEVAFAIRPSSSLPYFRLVMEGTDGWGVARLPQADPGNPATVLYGANVSVFRTTIEQQRSAWAFLKHFTSPEISVQWALGTGYVPYRKSAVDDPRVKAYWAEWPYNRTAFDCLEFARPEPNLEGWQIVRGLLEKAVTSVITGMDGPENALADLQRGIDQRLRP